MNIFKNKYKVSIPSSLALAFLLTACNKDVRQYSIPAEPLQSGISLDSVLRSNPNDSLYYRMIIRANAGPTKFITLFKATNVSNQYTLFVPDNNAMKVFVNAATGGAIPLAAPNSVFSTFLASTLPIASAAGIVGYNTIPQKYDTASISSAFPNMQVGTLIQPSPSSPFFTLTTFPSKRPGILRVNTIPMTDPFNVPAFNGIIHHMSGVVTPPQRVVWERINTDADLTIFKAAILRADSGTAAPGALVTGLLTGPANFTVFAPNNLAMKTFINAATGGLIPIVAPDAVFIGFLASNSLTTKLVKGIVVYHIFDDRSSTASPSVVNKRPGRSFTVNFPTSPTSYSTLLSSADSVGITYPPVSLTSSFAGPFVSSASIKGFGNSTPSNILINPTPDGAASYGTTPPALPITYAGTSDQLYVNAVLHKIDQVLRPQ